MAAQTPDNELEGIINDLRYSAYLSTTMAAFNLPSATGAEAVQLLRSSGVFDDGCSRLLSFYEGSSWIPGRWRAAVRKYNREYRVKVGLPPIVPPVVQQRQPERQPWHQSERQPMSDVRYQPAPAVQRQPVRQEVVRQEVPAVTRRTNRPDPEIGNITYKLKYATYLADVMRAAGLPPGVAAHSDTATSMLTEHGYFKNGCRKLLPILERLNAGHEPDEVLTMVRNYNSAHNAETGQ